MTQLKKDFAPFGESLESGSNLLVNMERRGWIGKEIDAENGLGDFGVRKYESEAGRFLSVDPLWEAMRKTNLYHYSMNNPMLLKDDNGNVPGNPTNDAEFANACVTMAGGALSVIGGSLLMVAPEPNMITKLAGGAAISTGIASFGLGLAQMAAVAEAESKDKTTAHIPSSFGGAVGYGIDKGKSGSGSKGESVGSLVETGVLFGVGGITVKGGETVFRLSNAIGN